MAQAAVVLGFFPVIISILVVLVVVVQGATDPQDGRLYLHPSHAALSSCLYALLQTCLRITESNFHFFCASTLMGLDQSLCLHYPLEI
jgi:hypothetical protein